MQREELNILQAALAGHFLQPRLSAALPDNHKLPGLIAERSSGIDHVLQPLLLTDVAGIKNDFVCLGQTQLRTQRRHVGRRYVAKTRHFRPVGEEDHLFRCHALLLRFVHH